eukprot:jgi/Mesvir1/4237/Mv22207-RA.1
MARTTLVKKVSVAIILMLLACSQGLLMQHSKVDGEYPFNVGVVILTSEIIKLAMSGLMLLHELHRDPKGTQITVQWEVMRLYPIPSIIFVLVNNVQFATVYYLDASTFQILGNLKIPGTGLLSWWLLKRGMTRLQWQAMLVFMLGAVMSQIQGCGRLELSGAWQGYFMGIMGACLSALAGVYTEFLMKKNIHDSINWQNIQLYFFGAVFNLFWLLCSDNRPQARGEDAAPFNPWWLPSYYHGFTWTTWVIVFNYSFVGLFISWITKHTNSLIRVYSTSCAMLLTAVAAIFLFNMRPTEELFLGITISALSLRLYFVNLVDDT